LKVRKVHFPYVGDCPMASACCFGYFVVWLASLKERDDVLYFMRGERLYSVGGEEADILVCLHLVQVYYRLHDILTESYDQGCLNKPSYMFLPSLALEVLPEQSKCSKHLTGFLRHCIWPLQHHIITATTATDCHHCHHSYATATMI